MDLGLGAADAVEERQRGVARAGREAALPHELLDLHEPALERLRALRDDVDVRYAQLTGTGYAGRQPPYDTFWGARYAIVEDPDGNEVGLMSPSDPVRRSAPPAI